MPPVANDSGSAIGTAIDAQFYFTGNPKIDWNVYSGRLFNIEQFDLEPYDVYDTNYELLADLLANDLVLGWVSGKVPKNVSVLTFPLLRPRVVKVATCAVALTVTTRSFEISVSIKTIGFPLLSLLTIIVFSSHQGRFKG